MAALFVSGFLVLSLVLLSHLRKAYTPAPIPAAKEETGYSVDDVRVELESVLLRSGSTLERVETGEGGELRMEARGEFPSAEIVSDLARRVRRISAGLALESRAAAGEIRILGEGISAVLLFRPAHPSVVEAPPEDRPKMVIIMDDLGRDVATARSLLDIDLPVTLSILPGTPNASRVATLAYRRGREVMIHVPMEPLNYPEENPGEDALFVGQSEAEIRKRFQGYLAAVPYAEGCNNHMGSRFTENREKMDVVLEEVKKAGLFFVDSLTTGHSVAYEEARKAGLPASSRDVFLDNIREVDRIYQEIRHLADLAGRKGSAVGICHPYPQTLEALRRASGLLREAGIEVVPASQVLVR